MPQPADQFDLDVRLSVAWSDVGPRLTAPGQAHLLRDARTHAERVGVRT